MKKNINAQHPLTFLLLPPVNLNSLRKYRYYLPPLKGYCKNYPNKCLTARLTENMRVVIIIS